MTNLIIPIAHRLNTKPIERTGAKDIVIENGYTRGNPVSRITATWGNDRMTFEAPDHNNHSAVMEALILQHSQPE